jgi:hypothetical protein
MRALTTAQTQVRASGVQADSYRVQIKDSGGTYRDLTTYPGFNAVQSISVGDSVGSPHMSAEVEVTREFFKLSLSPYMSGSAINRGFVHTATPVALIAIKREFKIEVAVTPVGRAPSSGDWFEVFRGRVDFVSPANGKTVRFGGRDLAGRIADQQIKTERIYAFAEVGGLAVALRPWAAGMVVAVGDYMLPASNSTSDSGANKFFVCDTAGTTGNTEPTWSTGANINDGTARWDYVGAPTSLGLPVEEVQQNLLDVNKAASDSSVTLYVPTSPSWAITQFLQNRGRNLQAIRALAQQIGWDCRMKWRAGTSQFELTLYEPERSKVVADYTFAVNTYEEPTKLEVAIENIRNAWRVIYSDTADLWPDGSAKRKTIEVSDATSITDYGELWAEIAESSNSNVNTAAEATKLANAALSDCARPTADFTVKTKQAFPWVELGDLYTFAADGRRYDVAQTFAVTGWKLTGKSGKLSTEFSMRGKPALSAWAWISQTIVMPFVMAETQPPPAIVHYPGGRNPRPATLRVPGGIGVSLAGDTVSPAGSGDTEYEVHVSLSSGFTPAAGTLKGVIKGQVTTIQELQPAVEHYAKIVPRVRERSGKLARGQPGAQFSFSPTRVGAGLLESVIFDDVPNGDFQDVFDRTTETPAGPPEHWAIGGGGTWGAAADVRQDVDSNMGRYLLFRATTNSVGMIASQFRVRLGTTSLMFSAYVMPSGTLGIGKNFSFNIEFYADPYGNNFLGDTTASAPNWYTPDVWTQFNQAITVPAGARYVRLTMNRETLDALHTWAVTGLTVFGNPILQSSARATSDAYLDTNDGTAHQIDTFTAADYQTNCDIDGGTSLLPTIGGMFMITVQAAWVSVDLSGVFFRTTELRVNGSTVGTLPTSAVDSDNNAVDAGFFLVRLAASDSVEVWVTNAFFGGNDMNVIATVTLEKVAP